MKPKFIIDDHIPFIKGVFDDAADIDYLSAKDITRDKVKDADALIIRTRTKCDSLLLEGSHVKLIVTATIGIDHIDTAYCESHGIEWHNAPGCNARSVAQWFGSAIAVWAEKNGYSPENKVLGIVGHGHVGHKVEEMARLLGMKVLLNDPILALNEPEKYTDLKTIAEKCDVISFHTPLTVDGPYKTFHLADKCFFDALKKHPYILNTARGGVIDESMLIKSLEKGTVSDCAIDCWENEPNTNEALRKMAIISTQHIAGYSKDGKYNASAQSIKTICNFFQIKPTISEHLSPQQEIKVSKNDITTALIKSYPILVDSNELKAHPESFELYRSHYPMRREIKLIIQ